MNGIFIGKTLEEAHEAAAKAFGADISRITFETLEEPKKGLFGKVKGDWKVKAAFEPTKIDIACKYIKNIFAEMELKCDVSGREEDECIYINIDCDDAGMVIGKKGEHLDALQYLVNVIVNRPPGEYCKVILDSNNYREKRRITLEELAAKVAHSVIKNGVSSALEPMNPYERRIIHSTIADIQGAYSRSVGNEPLRRVVVYPVNKRQARPQKDYHSKSSGSLKTYGDDFKTSFEKEYKRPAPDADIKTDLYGKIEV